MEEILVRKATIHDIEKLLEFEQGVIEAERPFDATLKEGKIHYYELMEMIDSPDVELVVALSHGDIIGSGYARIEKSKPYLKFSRHAYLGFMYVSPAHRGKGVNQKIIETLKQWANSKSINEMRLEVYVDNAAAIRAYEKYGFKKHMLEMRMGF